VLSLFLGIDAFPHCLFSCKETMQMMISTKHCPTCIYAHECSYAPIHTHTQTRRIKDKHTHKFKHMHTQIVDEHNQPSGEISLVLSIGEKTRPTRDPHMRLTCRHLFFICPSICPLCMSTHTQACVKTAFHNFSFTKCVCVWIHLPSPHVLFLPDSLHVQTAGQLLRVVQNVK
jgi:hypothetical protein